MPRHLSLALVWLCMLIAMPEVFGALDPATGRVSARGWMSIAISSCAGRERSTNYSLPKG